jgi:hypothetical protein
MYRTEAADGGFDTAFSQIGDLENSFRLLQSGDYYFVAEELCYFRKHADSSTASHELDMAAHLDWLLLAARYRKYLPHADLSSDEYCLNFIKSWTHNLECEMNREGRLGMHERAGLLHELFGFPDPLSPLNCEKDAVRNTSSEYKMLSALALLQCVLLESELRTFHDRIAQPYAETESAVGPGVDARPGLTAALDGLRRTLLERDKEISELRAKLDVMGNSASWKLTEPLRKAKDHFPRPCIVPPKASNGR